MVPPFLQIIAHRGFSARAPENTLAAVRAGLQAGADAVEWDLHVAACGTSVLIHDATLDRTTDGTGAVADRPLTALRELDAGSWFHADFAGERLPTFAEALAEVGPYGATVYPEIKGIREPADLDRMLREVAEAGMRERTVFISLEFDLVDEIAARDPDVRVGYVVAKLQQFQDAVGRARRLGSRGLVDLDHHLVLDDPLLPPRARAQGVDVAVWTVDTPEEAETLARSGVRRFTTNQVEALVRWRATRVSPPGEA
ncbi:MAG TPA: glycerophosphodiester phosphodiesterase family protein [Longimicrobiales bacterium]|nr:glycerophosphodiester phosphodiesterase family protein [Longimicrobiales bacterium]